MITLEHRKHIKERGLFDFVASEYWKMSKEDLATLCKEFAYAVHVEDEKICKIAEENMWNEISVE